MLKKLLCICFMSLCWAFAAIAQSQPRGADVTLYFPQFADGGDNSARWQTTFIFSNPDKTTSATVELFLLDAQGNGSPMNFGAGSSAYFSFTLPSMGTKVLRSTAASTTAQVGWAIAFASIPVQGTMLYRLYANGVPKTEVSAPPTLPTTRYNAPANRLSGVAINNAYSSASITVDLKFYDSSGQRVAGTQSVTVPPLGHQAVMLWQLFPTLTNDTGTVILTAHNATSPYNDEFVALVLSSDDLGIWSGLPDGAAAWPIAHWERIRYVYYDVLNAALKSGVLTSSPTLKITYGNEINARAYSDGSTVEVTMGLSQLLSDSPSELAFAIAHELGHMCQLRYGKNTFNSNSELDADVWGFFLMMGAGYDPYGSAGTLGKLMLVFGSAGLLNQWFDDIFNPHTSFANRIDNLYQTSSAACNLSPELNSICSKYKGMYHPNFPAGAPLGIKPPVDPVVIK